MSTHSTGLDLGSALAAPSTCPDCATRTLHTRSDDGDTVFCCASCGASWTADLGFLVPRPARACAPIES